MSKKICWITPDYFADTDTQVVPYLLGEFEITWIILFPWRNNRYKEGDFLKYLPNDNLKVHFFYLKYFRYDPRTLYKYKTLYNLIKKENYDCVYFNIVPTNPLIIPLYKKLNKENTIVTAHDGWVKPSFEIPWLAKICFKICYNSKNYIQLFSPAQEEIMKSHLPNKNTFVIPLGIKDFGKPTVGLRTDTVSFLSFGNINYDKNITILIKAAEKLYADGYRNFKIVVKGRCDNWKEKYQRYIKHPAIYELDLRFIDNSEIPDIFSYNTFVVLPYRQTGQSGVIKIAFQYRKPVIVSNLPGFLFDVKDGYNGFVFENENVDDLVRVLKKCLETRYDILRNNVNEFVENKYSLQHIMNLYKEMFNKVLN